jgi:hypothetical protein
MLFGSALRKSVALPVVDRIAGFATLTHEKSWARQIIEVGKGADYGRGAGCLTAELTRRPPRRHLGAVTECRGPLIPKEGPRRVRALIRPVATCNDVGSATSSERHGIAPCRSTCARKRRPLFRADMFRSWDARRSVPRTSTCPRNPLACRPPTLESFDFH